MSDFELDVRGLIALVLDGEIPEYARDTFPDDGPADDFARRSAIYWSACHDRELGELLSIVYLGETLDHDEVDWPEREKALDELERRRAGPVEQPISANRIDLIEELALADSPDRKERRVRDAALGAEGGRVLADRQSKPRASAVRIEKDGRVEYGELGSDEEAIRAFLEEGAAAIGRSLDELAAPFKRGRPTDAEKRRYDLLAILVHGARDREASLAGVGAVIGRTEKRISELALHGARLVGTRLAHP